MVWETFNRGNQYWPLCPDYIAYFLSVLLCFFVFLLYSKVNQIHTTHTQRS